MPDGMKRISLPGPVGKVMMERWLAAEAEVTGTQAPVVWDHAQGCTVVDVDGNSYLDWTSGVLVANVGHCHPDLVQAVQKAASRLLNNYECPNVERIEAAERLVAALPKHLDRCFFLTTGSEATEGALRLMKRMTGKHEILSFHGGFHGRTAHAASVGGLSGPKRNYGPTVPGIIRVPYPYPYRDPLGFCDDAPEFTRYFDFLDQIVSANSTGSLAGAIVEPYLGAGGFVFPPSGWLSRLQAWLRSKGMLFTLDEVQSGYGRTGSMWAMDHENLEPDLVTLGKGIGSGTPVSAIAARSEIFQCLRKGEMSSTFGGNPMASAAVSAVLDIFQKEPLVDNACSTGAHLLQGLRKLQQRHPCIGDVRGMGLVIGLEIVKDPVTKEPFPQMIPALIQACAEHGVLIGAVGMYGNVIRVAPPLCMTIQEADESLTRVGRAFESLGL